MTKTTEQTIIEKLRELSLERQTEVADFIDFLAQRESSHFAQTALTTLWDKPTDAEYYRA